MTSEASTRTDLFRYINTFPASIHRLILSNKIISALLLVITMIFLYTRLFDFPNRFGFAHDMEFAANTAWSAIVEKKITLIGQETSVGGLFVGPIFSYLQTLVMFFANLNPLALGYLAVSVSFINLIFLFFVVCDIFDKKQALIAVILYTVSYRLVSYDISGNMLSYIMLASLLIFWASYKVFIKNKDSFLPLLLLFISITFHIHFALFLLIPAVLVLYFIFRPKIRKQYLFLSLILFALPFLPLVVFELRHNFLITNNLINLSKDQTSGPSGKLALTTNTFLDLLTEGVILKTKYFFLVFTAVIGAFIALTLKEGQKNYLAFMLVLLFTPLILLYVYKGPIPEYYFLPCVPFFLIITSHILSKMTKKLLPFLVLILLIISITNFNRLIKTRVVRSFAFKNNIVDWIISDSQGKTFNLYYQIPLGLNTGYTYLFKWKNHLPQENAENLYIIHYAIDEPFNLEPYKKSFPDKNVTSIKFDVAHIVSIK